MCALIDKLKGVKEKVISLEEKMEEIRIVNRAKWILIDSDGMSEEDAFRLAANFGGGMQMGGTCGAFTGGMMALGLWGVDEKTAVQKLIRAMKANHEGTLDCAKLLAKNAETGLPRKPHCDGMVYEAVELVEEILRAEGKIG